VVSVPSAQDRYHGTGRHRLRIPRETQNCIVDQHGHRVVTGTGGRRFGCTIRSVGRRVWVRKHPQRYLAARLGQSGKHFSQPAIWVFFMKARILVTGEKRSNHYRGRTGPSGLECEREASIPSTQCRRFCRRDPGIERAYC